MTQAVKKQERGLTSGLVRTLLDAWQGLDGLALLKAVLRSEEDVNIAVSSSFGAESAVLLDLVSQIDTATPVLTVDTGKLFEETVAYRDRLVDHFGLSDVRVLEAYEGLVHGTDPDGLLHQTDPDLCCQVRKVMPHAQAADDFDVLITGRKRFHGGGRGELPTVQVEGAQIKINPLATWSERKIEAAFLHRDLPPHPLVAEGYSSIGCATCTFKTGAGDGVRDGRWAGKEKTECGIHLPNFGVTKNIFNLEALENGQ